jgi:hypothetical protein
MPSSSFAGDSFSGTDMVPRQLLQDSQESVERLKRQLNDALANQDSEVNVAVHTLQAQLRAVQKQQKTTEEQLNRSLAREKDLREQVVNTDVVSAMGQLRKENRELREKNEALSEQATRGQQAEAQLIVLRNKLEAANEEVLLVRAGDNLELHSTREEVTALKGALELAQIDMIRSEKVMRREKEMQQVIDRSAEELNDKDRKVSVAPGIPPSASACCALWMCVCACCDPRALVATDSRNAGGPRQSSCQNLSCHRRGAYKGE